MLPTPPGPVHPPSGPRACRSFHDSEPPTPRSSGPRPQYANPAHWRSRAFSSRWLVDRHTGKAQGHAAHDRPPAQPTRTRTRQQVDESKAARFDGNFDRGAGASAPAPDQLSERGTGRLDKHKAPQVERGTGRLDQCGSARLNERIVGLAAGQPAHIKRASDAQRYRRVLEEWKQEAITRADARHTRESARLKSLGTSEVGASDGNNDATEHDLFDIINGRIGERTRYTPPLGPDSPARRHIAAHPATVRILARLAAAPFLPPPPDSPALRRVRYDPFVSKSDGAVLEPTECEADSLGADDDAAQYYLRSLVFPDVAAARAFLEAYQDRFGDACWVKATLRSLELSQVDPESAVALQYAGLTIRATPGGRVDADLQSAGTSRCSHLLQFARRLQSEVEEDKTSPPQSKLELMVHEFIDLRLPASRATDANQPVIGDTEVALIAAIKPASFNSANGGRLLRVDPSALAEYTDIVRSLGATRAQLDQLAPLDPVPVDTDERIARIKRALDDSIAYFSAYAKSEAGPILDRMTDGGQRAYEDILANMTALCTRANGCGFDAFKFLLTKDVTKGSLEGVEPFSSGNNSARGLTAGYLLDRLVQDAEASEQGWRNLMPSANLWAVILWHWLILLALLFAARVLHIAQPLLLVTHSGVVNDHLRQGHVRDLLEPDSDKLETFLNAEQATNPDLIKSIRCANFDLADHCDSNEGGWIATVGSTAVV